MPQVITDWLNSTEGWVSHHVPELVRDILEVILYLLPATLALVVIYIIYKTVKGVVLGAMRAQNRREVQIHRVHSLLKYTFLLAGIILIVVSLSGSFAAMGISAAFLSMILGWSLQRPVTGVAAWLMVMIKRPFQIGDRIILQGVRGDVLDISPTHILLGEVGGTIGGEEKSNRAVLIPNAVLFDQMVTNYAVSQEAKYILDEVPVRISYQSEYRLSEQTLIDCASEVTPEIIEETGETPFVRAEFFHSGITMRLRYKSIAVERERISSEIVGKIVDAFGKNDRIEFAYRHFSLEHPSGEASVPGVFV